MIRIENAIKFLKEELNEKFSKNETLSLIRILFEDLLMISKTQMLSQPEKKISAEQLEALRKACEKLLQSEPIQYITGKSYFCGNVFNVRPGVLIPRPETEELVELICEQNREKDNFRILDIGTGSGCIAISLAKMFKNSTVFALDFSIEALGIAKENARINDVDIKLLHENILVQKKINILQEFDIVVSNPPYVTESEKKHMVENVLLFEPETALFVSNAKKT
jgi:release factor glutamine methyltransferase